MKKRMTILFLVFLMLLVSLGCGPWFDKVLRTNPRNQSPAVIGGHGDAARGLVAGAAQACLGQPCSLAA